MELTSNDALIVVDMQNDFMPGGSLAVKDGDKIIPKINKHIKAFEGLPVIYTRDWHPKNHCSFKENGGIWPVHCVQGTVGAQFYPDLYFSDVSFLVSKATKVNKDAYSGFKDTLLGEYLICMRVKRVFVCGVATEYCVKHTVLDALAGFEVVLLRNACKAVNIQENDGMLAEEEMCEYGAILYSGELNV